MVLESSVRVVVLVYSVIAWRKEQKWQKQHKSDGGMVGERTAKWLELVSQASPFRKLEGLAGLQYRL